MARKLIASNQVDLLVVDSMAALVSSAELDAAAGDQFVGIQARMMSQNLKSIVPVLGLSKTALVFINQTRFKIAVMFGSPETTPGGVALPFYASLRLRGQRVGKLGPKGAETGIVSRAKVVKNCLAAPWKEAEFEINFGQGIDLAGELLDLGVEAGLLDKSGSWYSYGEEKLGNGREACKSYLREHPDLLEAIHDQLK